MPSPLAPLSPNSGQGSWKFDLPEGLNREALRRLIVTKPEINVTNQQISHLRFEAFRSFFRKELDGRIRCEDFDALMMALALASMQRNDSADQAELVALRVFHMLGDEFLVVRRAG